jgi:hypothetical protein
MLLQPPAAANEVKTVSWNTGDPVPGSNSSHAESSFSAWFEKVVHNVKEVHININFSPCSMCSLGTLPVMSGKGITTSLNYSKPYESYDKKTGVLREHTTTKEDIGKLTGTGWNPKGKTPEWTDAKKAEAIKKRWAELEKMW